MADHFGHFTRVDLALRQCGAFFAGVLWTVAFIATLVGAWVHAIAPAVFAAVLTALLVRIDYWDARRRRDVRGI
jgi:hypothetical protein